MSARHALAALATAVTLPALAQPTTASETITVTGTRELPLISICTPGEIRTLPEDNTALLGRHLGLRACFDRESFGTIFPDYPSRDKYLKQLLLARGELADLETRGQAPQAQELAKLPNFFVARRADGLYGFVWDVKVNGEPKTVTGLLGAHLAPTLQ